MSLEQAFDSWKARVNEKIAEHPLEIISWEATRACNLNCVHCGSPLETWVRQNELTTDEVIGAFSQIAEDFDLSRFHHINITGGEPFVRKDLIEILQQISQVPQYRNIAIQTNGIYIAENPQVLQELRQFGVTGLGVSIDGLRDTHDLFRRRKGCFDKSIEAAKKGVKAGLVVTVSTVAHAQNIDEIPQLYEEVRKFHPRYFRVMTIDPIGRAGLNNDYLLSPEQTKQVIDFLRQKHEENFESYADPKTTIVELGCGGWLSTELEGRVRPYIFHCIAGINNLGILYDGKLASCSNVSREFIEGDLRTERIRDVWERKYQRFRDREWLKKGDCKECGEWDYCHGGPMHKRLGDGTMLDCLYQTLSQSKDYRACLPESAFTTRAGN
jgi:radical SAM protein with 4Fe4S-binding SPASM domain